MDEPLYFGGTPVWKGGSEPTISTSFAYLKQTCRTEPKSIKGTQQQNA